MRLTELKKDIDGKILCIESESTLKERLLEIGFSKGTIINFKYEFNTTFAFKIKNSLVALRKEDAEKIYIEVPA